MAILGRVRGPKGFNRPVTDKDALWAARALIGEAGRNAWQTKEGYAILWTMLNRWVLTSDVLPRMSYGDLLQRYCQPINPAWLHGGAHDPDPTKETDVERRRLVRRSLGWHQLPPQLRKVVYDVLTGRVPAGPYAGLVHFAAPDVRPASGVIGPVELPGVPTDSNVFFKVPATKDWTSETVTVRSESTRQTLWYTGAGLALGTLAVGLLVIPAYVPVKEWW